jgi:hypothetical protein
MSDITRLVFDSQIIVDRERVNVVIRALQWIRENDRGEGRMYDKAAAEFALNYDERGLLTELGQTIARVQV